MHASLCNMTLSKEQLRQLELLKICPQHLRKSLLKRLPSSCIKAICECTLNVLHGNVPLTKQQKNCLRKHKCTLRQIGNKKGSLFTKKKLIIQKGGFLNILIPAALTAISTLINGIR